MNRITKQELQRMSRQYIVMLSQSSSTAKANLATLRKTTPRKIENLPKIWPLLYAVCLPDLPTYETKRVEQAALGMLVIFAQEARYNEHAHENRDYSSGIGTALQQVAAQRGNLDRKFSALVQEKDYFLLLRGVLNLLRLSDNHTRIDYTKLIWELYQVQSPSQRKSVLHQWGREYYRVDNNQEKETEEKS